MLYTGGKSGLNLKRQVGVHQLGLVGGETEGSVAKTEKAF